MRRGSNKSNNLNGKKQRKKRTTTSKIEKAKTAAKKKIAAKASQQQSRSAFERQEVVAPRVKPKVGTAIVLSHGAGGSSSHSSMRAWSARLSPLCDELISFDFPRPFNQMACLAGAQMQAVQEAYTKGHRRIILVGVGMGARVALHMITGVPGDDGNSIEASLPAAILDCIKGQIALAYPLRKVGSQTIRDAAIRALPNTSAPLLFVSGDNDPHTELPALEGVLAACKATTDVHVVEGGDQSLHSKVNTDKSMLAVLDAMTAFVEKQCSAAP